MLLLQKVSGGIHGFIDVMTQFAIGLFLNPLKAGCPVLKMVDQFRNFNGN